MIGYCYLAAAPMRSVKSVIGNDSTPLYETIFKVGDESGGFGSPNMIVFEQFLFDHDLLVIIVLMISHDILWYLMISHDYHIDIDMTSYRWHLATWSHPRDGGQGPSSQAASAGKMPSRLNGRPFEDMQLFQWNGLLEMCEPQAKMENVLDPRNRR